jgi:Carboxypeptidase regulatory-like domain/TonB-dependent Receptor Plug Domain
MPSNRTHLYPAAMLLLGMLRTANLPAQIGGGSIIGFVTDATKAAVPGAAVKATNVDSNVTMATVTSSSGYFEFPLLPAGKYFVEADKDGFRTARSATFTLSTGTQPRLDLTMEVAGTASSVEVTAQAPLVNAATTDLGQVVGSGKVEALPLNGRNWQQLVNLQPGASGTPSNSVGARGGMSFNGSPGYGNQLLLDGVDMSFGEISSAPTDQAAGAGTSLIGGVSVAAIAEVKVNSSSFSAEYGSATGGVVNLTTKAGTNQFHGELFEFFRNDKLDATDFFTNKAGLKKPPLRWNQFGGNLGGPIKKNKLFFFFNYEAARVRNTVQLSGNTPTPLLLSQLTPALRENASGLPQNFTPTSNPLLGFSIRNAQTVDTENTTLSRADYNFGQQHLAVRFSYNWSNYQIPQFRPANVQSAPFHFYNLSVEHTDTISPSMLNEFRFGFSRNNLDRKSSTLGVLPGWFEVGPVSLIGDFQSEIHYITNTYTITDNFTVIHNAHTFKAGVQMLHLDSTRYQNTGMTTYYNTLSDLIADQAALVRVTFGSPKALANWQSGFFASDDWRINRHLLLKAGLRYEYYTPLHGAFNVASSDPFGPFIKDKSQPMFASNPHDFGPRLGVVWDPLGNQKFVIRAGGSMTYMPLQPMLLYDFAFISSLLPFSANFTPADAGTQVSLAFPFPQSSFVQQATANPSIVSSLGLTLGRNIGDFHSKDGAAGQWNLSIQSALTNNLALQASYVGNHAYHLWVPTFPNHFLPGSPTRPVPSIGAVDFTCSCAASSYDALQISLNEKNVHGLVFDAYYTWAKTLSYGVANGTNNVANNNVQDVYNFRGSYGPVDGDIRHLFVLNHSCLLPTPGFAQQSTLGKGFLGGWSLQGIMTKRSGFPLNVFSGLDLVRNQRPTGDRPNLVAGANPYIRNMNSLLWLNAAAFDNQTPFNNRQYGNLGYNALFGPGAFTYDAALHKSFRITESSSLTFRGEAFNIFNHVVFNNPVNTLTNPTFGQITSGSPGRKVQLALTYAF